MTKKSTHDDFDMDLDNHKQIVNILKKQQCQYITINRLLAFFFFFDKKAALCQYESRYNQVGNDQIKPNF